QSTFVQAVYFALYAFTGAMQQKFLATWKRGVREKLKTKMSGTECLTYETALASRQWHRSYGTRRVPATED
ncbi:MAG: hypothetical protein AB7E98_17485, partial [Pirellulales bacterium]